MDRTDAALFNLRKTDTKGEFVTFAKDRRVHARPGHIMLELYGVPGTQISLLTGRVGVDLDARGLPHNSKTARALEGFLAQVAIDAEICLTPRDFRVRVVTDNCRVYDENGSSRLFFSLFDDSAHGRLQQHAWLDEHHPGSGEAAAA